MAGFFITNTLFQVKGFAGKIYPMSEKKTGFTAPLEFIRSVGVELASVKWPTRQETMRLTGLVIFVSLFVALYIGGLDLAFTSLIQKIINR